MVKEFQYKNHLARIIYDDARDSESPRDWDNMGTLVCFNRTYDYTDRDAPKINTKDFESLEDVKMHLIRVHGAIVILPVYLYAHSCVSVSTAPFSCPFDSGQLGWIYTTRDDILDTTGKNRLTKGVKDLASDYLEEEVKSLNQWLSGDVYAYVIDPQDNEDTLGIHGSNCGGYFDLDHVEDSAKRAIDELRGFDEEQDLIKNLPVEDLPKYLNHNWKYSYASVGAYKNRLKEANNGTDN